MNREELQHAIRAATTILEIDRVYIIGSQSILGSFAEDQLPPEATDSNEIDIWPLGDDAAGRLSEKLLAVGELSEFHETYGFYIDGVSNSTAVLPAGWHDRLVEVPALQVNGARVVGLCLDPHDLCVAKLIANRDKDRRFVRALVLAGLIDAGVLLDRLADVAAPIDRIDGPQGITSVERDINYAWVQAQTLREEQQSETSDGQCSNTSR